MGPFPEHEERIGAAGDGVLWTADGSPTGEQQFSMGQLSWIEASTGQLEGEPPAVSAASPAGSAGDKATVPATIPCPFYEEPVFQLMDSQVAFGVFAEGHCPNCGIRIRSWNPGAGAFEPCRLRPQEAMLLVD